MRLRLVLLLALVTAFAATAGSAGAAKYKFGSKLNSTVQPSNANTAHPCIDEDGERGKKCTWVMNEAYGRPDGGEKAKNRGTIKKIRLIAGEAGKFRLQIVRARELNSGFEGKAVRKGPVIEYEGQAADEEPYLVEVFNVNIPIRKGERLAIRTNKTSTLRCSSGGPNTLLWYPPLVIGAGFRGTSDDDGCWLLLEAVVRT